MEPTLVLALERASRSKKGLRFINRRESETFVSYEEIHERANRAAGKLQKLGVRSGDRVAIVLPTGLDFFDAFYGCLLAGAVPVPLYPPVRLGRLDEYHNRTSTMLRGCGARLLLTDRRVGSLLGRTMERSSVELGARILEDLDEGTPNAREDLADSLALIQFSSGTSHDPKPVRLTHRQILANVETILQSILKVFPERSDRIHVGASWLPLYHDMGLVGTVLTAMAHPSDLVLLPPEVFVARPALWLRAISRFKATVSPAPNFAYSLCVDRIRDEEMEGVDLSSWLLALNGAEPVTPSVLARFIDRFRRFGLREEALTPVYGLAEAALAVTFSNPVERFRSLDFDRGELVEKGLAVRRSEGQELVSVGRPLAGYAIQIVDKDDRPLPDGSVGRLLVRGPSLMEGYHGLDEQTAEVLKDDWLDTGDTGFVHDGELFLYGREKDLIILRGRNHSPDGIEQCLADLPGARQGCWAAVGVLRDEGEELVVLVERSRKGKVAVSELQAGVRERIVESSGLVPAEVHILEPGTLPRTSSGRIRRAEAKRRFIKGTLNPPKPVNPIRMAVEVIRSKMAYSRK